MQIWPPDGATCISCIATLPWIALLALSVSIDLLSSSARVTSVKFQKHLVRTSGPKDRTPGLPGSDKKETLQGFIHSFIHSENRVRVYMMCRIENNIHLYKIQDIESIDRIYSHQLSCVQCTRAHYVLSFRWVSVFVNILRLLEVLCMKGCFCGHC